MNRTILFTVARALAAAALPGTCLHAATALAASPCEDGDGRVAIDIASELGDETDDAAMHTYLSERLPERLGALDLCADPQASTHVLVTVAWSNAAHGDYSIVLRAAIADGEPFEPAAVECAGCATAEVLDTIAREVPVALAGLEAEPPASRDDEPAAPPPPTPTTVKRSEADRVRLGRLGRAGIGLGAAGLAGVVTGAVLWAQREVVHPADARYQLQLRPAGITLVVTGIVAAAAGGTMIGIDRGRARSRRLSAHASAGRGRVGVWITGSF